jgi:hypothetical protein
VPPAAAKGTCEVPSPGAMSSTVDEPDDLDLEPEPPEIPPKIPHRGFIIDAATGVLGCTRAMCAGDGGLAAQPGVFVGGFVGGNIGGFVELGVRGGWGKLRSRGGASNPASDWGVSPGAVQADLLERSSSLGDIPIEDTFAEARTHEVDMSAYNVAPALRLHFVPRGRVIAFAGAGGGYGGFRTDYATDRGRMRVTAHGIAVPAEAGLGVHITKNVAVVARFDYVWMRYVFLGFDAPDETWVVPTSMSDRAADEGGTAGDLPHFWTVTLGLRARLF